MDIYRDKFLRQSYKIDHHHRSVADRPTAMFTMLHHLLRSKAISGAFHKDPSPPLCLLLSLYLVGGLALRLNPSIMSREMCSSKPFLLVSFRLVT